MKPVEPYTDFQMKLGCLLFLVFPVIIDCYLIWLWVSAHIVYIP
jgi:hypothetical protein